MSCASIPRTGSFSFTVSSIARWRPQSERAGRAFGSSFASWKRHFPSDKIDEALKRLVDRRYVLPASRSSAGAVAAYWASLGLPPEIAEKNLQKCRVRIQSIDVQGAKELGGALGKLGVRVVDRAPDLTVTLVSDYLERRLGELNRQHLSDRTPWVLVQPSGIFPLGGAGVQPGQERLLDLSLRSHDPEPGDQGISRPRTGALCRGFAARPQYVGTERHPACCRRDRESDRHRLPHRFAAITSSASTCRARPW